MSAAEPFPPDPSNPTPDRPPPRPRELPRRAELSPASVEPHVFLDRLRPLLPERNLDAIADALTDMGGAGRIVPLLQAPDADVRKVAALALSLVGDRECLDPLTSLLRQRDPIINQMAEHALWSIWFRLGTDAANRSLARGAEAMNDLDYPAAEAQFTTAIERCPTFAEAYNQRAIVRHLVGHSDASAADSRQAVRLMPEHFGAWAGLGHCHTEGDRFAEAAHCYRRALRINPHLASVREMLDELEALDFGTDGDDVT